MGNRRTVGANSNFTQEKKYLTFETGVAVLKYEEKRYFVGDFL